MTALITLEDIIRYKQISTKPNLKKLNEIILDAQLIDLQPLIGERLYNRIVANPSDYTELLDGGAYDYNSEAYTNYGLKMVLVYFTYARYMMFGGFTDTPSGTVVMRKDNSDPIDTTSKRNIYQLNRESAIQLWANVSSYLTRTRQPLFNNCETSAPRSSGMRFTKLG